MNQQNNAGKGGSGQNLCPMCRKPLKQGSFFCTGCGHRIGEPPKAKVQPQLNPELLKYQARQAVTQAPGAQNPQAQSTGMPSLNAIFREFLGQYLIFLITIGIFLLIGAGVFTWALLRFPHLERPVQLNETKDALYLSSTKMLAKYTPDGDLEWKATKAGKNRPLSGRLDFEFGPDGDIYVANTGARTVEVFSPDGEWLIGIGKGQFSDAFTLTFLKDGRLAVADTNAQNLTVYTIDGDLDTRVGSGGSGPQQFLKPGGIAQLPDGLIHVADTGNRRMQRIDKQNIFRETWDLAVRDNLIPERGGMVRAVKSIISEQTFSPARIMFDPVRDHVHICYVDDIDSPAPQSFILRMTTDGAPVESTLLTGPEGRPMNIQRLTPALNDKIAVVDPGAYTVGLWDPAADRFEAISNSGISMEMERMSGAAASVRTLRGVGGFLLFLGFAGVAAGLFLVGKEYKERREQAIAALRPRSDHRPPDLY